MKKVAILTSGGDAPGMNAAIRAFTRTALLYGMEVFGVRGGFKGLYDDRIFRLGNRSVSEKLNRGGTFLGSARFPEFNEDSVCNIAAQNLIRRDINYLIVIGGDGSYRGALKLSKAGINVIGIPGTIDNDITSSQFTIGFDTAVNTVVEAIDKIRDTSSSHTRCSIIEVMGRNWGDIALHSGIAVGAEAIYTKNDPFCFDDACKVVKEAKSKYKKHSLIVITENICNVIELAEYIEDHTGYETRSTILGHIQRGGTPSAFDRFLASTLGAYAADLINQDIYNVCVGTTGMNLYHTPIISALDLKHDDKSYFYNLAKQLK